MGERFSIPRITQPDDAAEAHRHITAPEAPPRPPASVVDVAHPFVQNPLAATLRIKNIGSGEQYPRSLASPKPTLSVEPGVGTPFSFKGPTPDLFAQTPINVDHLARKFDIRNSHMPLVLPERNADLHAVQPHQWHPHHQAATDDLGAVRPHARPSEMPIIHRQLWPGTSGRGTGEPEKHHPIKPIIRRHPDSNPSAAATATPFQPPTEGGGNPTPKPSQPPTEGGNPSPKPSPKSSAPPTEGGNPCPKPSSPPTEGGHVKPGPPLTFAPPAELHIWNEQFAPTKFDTAESSTWIKVTNPFPVAQPPQKSDVCAPCNIPCIAAVPKHVEPHHNAIPSHPEHPKATPHHLPFVPNEQTLPPQVALTPTVELKKSEHHLHTSRPAEIPVVIAHPSLQHPAPTEPKHQPIPHVEPKLPHILLHHTPLPEHKPKHKLVPAALPDCPPTRSTPDASPVRSVETHTSTTTEHHVKKASGIYTDLTLNSDGTSNITVGKWLDRRNYVNVSVDAGAQGLGNTRLTAGHALVPAYNADGTATKGTLNIEASAIIPTGHSYNSSQLPVDGGAGGGVSVNGYRSVSADNNTKIYGSADYVHTSQINNETDTQLGVSRTIGHVPVSLGIEHTTVSDYHPSNYIQAGTSINLDKSGTKQFFLNATKSLNTGKTTVWGGVTISIK